MGAEDQVTQSDYQYCFNSTGMLDLHIAYARVVAIFLTRLTLFSYRYFVCTSSCIPSCMYCWWLMLIEFESCWSCMEGLTE
jgi:hypothetical protein